MGIPETSLIPATVSLLRFYQENGFSSFFQNYPYWYFGEVSFKYLIGPLTPLLFNSDVLINNLIYSIPLFIFVSAIGWGLFFVSFFKEKRLFVFLLPFTIYLLTPLKYLYGLALSDFSTFFAKSLIPFFLILLYKKKYILATLFLVFLLLINTSVFPSIFVFSICLSIKNFKFQIKNLLYILISAHFISMLWYGPFYYLKILMNPSIGGRMGIGVILGIFNFFKLLLPVFLAFVAVKFSGKIKKRLPIFIVGSIISFGTLTLYRFFANPEFFFDYITWIYELEIALALLASYAVYKMKYRYILVLLLPIFFAVITLSRLKFTPFLNEEVLVKLDEIAKNGERVFISGSPVFSINDKFDVIQLRGGRDEVIKNKDWLDASYIFRESRDNDLITQKLHLLKIKYVLVHTSKSNEYYKDFKNEEVWGSVGREVFDIQGDKIYEID